MTPDSGTSCLAWPSWALNKFKKAGLLPVKKNCESEFDFPTMTFTINNIDYDIPSNHYMQVIIFNFMTYTESERA